MVGIPQATKRNTMKKIYFWNYDENDEEDKDKWGVDYDGVFGPFLNIIEYEKEFGYYIENNVSMGEEGHNEVK